MSLLVNSMLLVIKEGLMAGGDRLESEKEEFPRTQTSYFMSPNTFPDYSLSKRMEVDRKYVSIEEPIGSKPLENENSSPIPISSTIPNLISNEEVKGGKYGLDDGITMEMF